MGKIAARSLEEMIWVSQRVKNPMSLLWELSQGLPEYLPG